MILVHGEPGPQKILGAMLREPKDGGTLAVHAPAAGERIAI